MADLYTRASRVAVLELAGRQQAAAIAHIMRGMDRDYLAEWPSAAYDWAIQILAECRSALCDGSGVGFNGYIHPYKANET